MDSDVKGGALILDVIVFGVSFISLRFELNSYTLIHHILFIHSLPSMIHHMTLMITIH